LPHIGWKGDVVRKPVLAVCVVMAAGFLTVPVAHASPPWLGPGMSKHVCDITLPGEARCHAIIRTDDELNPLATAGPAGYGPADLRSAYAISGNSTRTIAIIDAFGYPNAEADLAKYRAQFGLPPCTSANGCFTKLNEFGQPTPLPANNHAWMQEQAIDLDMTSAICPGCKLILIEAKSASLANLSTAVQTAGQLGVHAISNSYGAGEHSATPTVAARYNIPGVAVTASNGDNGYGVQFPAASPFVTAVGGTSLLHASNPRGWSETVWGRTGAGCSTVFAKPAWQTDPVCTRRTVGDVSAVANPNTGVAVFAPGPSGVSGWFVFGGTSVACPIIAAAYAINGGAVNYAAGIYANPHDLNDITSGRDGTCVKSRAYLCTAEVGYDGPTGLGTPIGTGAFG
jgi:subtilase family serine protease